jgi:hypothetical protein
MLPIQFAPRTQQAAAIRQARELFNIDLMAGGTIRVRSTDRHAVEVSLQISVASAFGRMRE